MASHFYEWGDGWIHYRKSGWGDPLLLVHDLYAGASSEEFEHNIRALSSNHSVYAIDLLGFGESDAPRMRYRAALYPQLLKEFIEEVIRTPVHAVGSGISGAYVAAVAAERPELLRKVVFISPHECAGEDTGHTWAGKLLSEAYRLLLTSFPFRFIYQEAMSGQWELGEMIRRAFHNKKRIDPGMVDRLHELAQKPQVLYAYASLDAGLLYKSFRDVLPRVKSPTLFICGREVRADFAGGLERLAQLTPGSQTQWVDQAGTWVHQEMSSKTNRLIENFLEETQGEGASRTPHHELNHAA